MSKNYWSNHSMRRRQLLSSGAAGATGLAGLAMVGCGGGDDNDAVGQPTPGGTPTATVGKTTGPCFYATCGTPVRGGVLRTDATLTGNMDMGLANESFLAAQTIAHVYARLTRPSAKHPGDFDMEGMLAESWEIPGDGLTVTLKLVKNAKWHNKPPTNGRVFTSADVKWNVEYYRSKKKTPFQLVSNVETPDDNTAILKLKEPYADLLNSLGDYDHQIVNREVFERDGGFAKTFVGLGDMTLEAFEPGVKVVMKRNPDYWEMGVDGKSLPYLDGYERFAYPDYAGGLAAFRAGQLDMFLVSTPDLPSLKSSNAEIEQDGFASQLRLNSFLLRLNLAANTPVVKDVRIRQAISFALDRETILRDGWNGDGLWAGIIPVIFGPPWAWSQEKLKQKYPYDPKKAKELLSAAGYKGEQWDFNTQSGPGRSEASQLMDQMFKEVGLNGKQNAVQNNWLPGCQKGDFDTAYFTEVVAGQLDGWLTRMYQTGNQAMCPLSINDSKLDSLLAKQRAELDTGKRASLVDQIQEYIWQNQFIIPTIIYNDHYLMYPHVKGYVKHWNYNEPHLERAWIDKKKS